MDVQKPDVARILQSNSYNVEEVFFNVVFEKNFIEQLLRNNINCLIVKNLFLNFQLWFSGNKPELIESGWLIANICVYC